MSTQTKQTRSVVLVDGVEKFKLYIEVLDAGDLPSASLFLVQIEDATDPKEDVFARVVTLSDFDNYGTDRATAVTAGEEYYRKDDHTFYYDNLETAVSAQDVIKSRIDELVEDWNVYQTSFVTTPTETTIHPQIDEDTFNALVTAHTNAVAAEAAALTAKNTAQDEYDEAVADAATASSNLTNAQDRKDTCDAASAAYTNCLTTLNGLYTNADSFRTEAATFYAASAAFRTLCTGDPPTDPQKATYDGAASNFENDVVVFNTQMAQLLAEKTEHASNGLATITSMCSDLGSEVTAAESAKTDAEAAIVTKSTALANATTAHETAQAQTQAAYDAVKALKPDWEP